ncbi:Pollen_Ole_e_I domain-containing protein [Cephalotus follicularis]|uniref:Pollen_Ole_e_I domain-containing protein n=1 Tax=Cephalotus follicularis TaxID=3775 RepID=A0A1Q3DBN8_CEPFO|nr:Pollen_Ole_e_I domain-containing protein [Cephalotus follicularis]
MAKCIILLVSALCLFSLLSIAHGDERFFVEGKIYCDTCRAQFITRASQYMKGAKVRLECRDREGGSLTFSVEGETDESGTYRLQVEGDHEEEICEIVPLKSGNPDCNEVNQDYFLRKSARISLTKNNGIASPVRAANPLGFMKKEPLPECPEVLKELGITPSGLV